MIDPAEHWALWRADPRATPFQSPAWLDAWWAHLGQGERIDVVARDAGRLAAALPCFVWQDGPVRRLVPAGAGTSDYSDALLDPATPDSLDRLWAAIDAERWDELLLPDLRSKSPLLGSLPPGWHADDDPHEICPVLTYPPDRQVLAGLSKSRRRKIVHDRNRADHLGGVETRLAGPDEIDAALDALFALHAARWAAQGEPGVLADSKTQAFLRAAAPALAEAELLRLAVVRHVGEIVAVLLGFEDGRRGYSYINGVAFTPGQSFGTLAFACLVEGAAAEGADSFHFLRGEEPYKYAWGAEPTTTIRRVIRRG
jgi:CelD/BcsL family acetyltransferase involved in cellulose biosynthesis